MVPNGWQLVQLGDVVEFINGKAHENAINSSGKFIVVNSKFISSDGNVVKRTDLPLCVAQSHDVLMVMSDVPNGKAIAKCFYVETNELYTVNQRIGILRSTKIDSLFLYYVVNRNTYYLQFDDGLKQTNLRKDEVLNCSIRLPPLPEQRKIAQILSTWDKAIATAERLLANKQQQKKALMQRLLTGKQRFAGFEGEWQNLTLAEVAQITMGSSPLSTAYNDSGDGLPLIQGNADIKDRLSAPRIHTSQITKECFSDDVLLSVRAPVGTVAKSRHHACIGRGIAAIRAKGLLSQEYLYQLLLDFEPKWERLSQGSTFESVNSDDIKSLPVRLPCIKEQQKIASVLLATDTEITTIQSQLDNLKLQKKALMQQLLTGKRRVKVDSPDSATLV